MTFQFNNNVKDHVNNDVDFVNQILRLSKQETFDFIQSCKEFYHINELHNIHIKAVLRYVEKELNGTLISTTNHAVRVFRGDDIDNIMKWQYNIPHMEYPRFDIYKEWFTQELSFTNLMWGLWIRAIRMKGKTRYNNRFMVIICEILDYAYEIECEIKQSGGINK